MNSNFVKKDTLTFNERSFVGKANIKLSHISSVSIYSLKTRRQSKLIWMELSENAPYGSILASFCNQEVKVIKMYNAKGLQFNFSNELQKGYIVDIKSGELTHFKINELEAISEEKKVKFAEK